MENVLSKPTLSKKEAQSECTHFLSPRFTKKDRAIVAELLMREYKDGFINGYNLKIKEK